jgi:hypothetical protein
MEKNNNKAQTDKEGTVQDPNDGASEEVHVPERI